MKWFVMSILWVATACSVPATESISLLDKELSQFEVWVGVPHASVKGLPEGTYQSTNVTRGIPLGLNVERPKIFTMIEEDGEPVLHVSGEIYAGLTTLQEYENYHLSVWHKWGEKKWPPREKQKRDSGILYHAYGSHGNFWKVWKTSLEYQIQETDLGDFIGLSGNTATPPTGDQVADIRGSGTVTPKRYDPASEQYFKSGGYIHACSEHDAPHGQWNHLELYVIGGTAVHVVNEQVVMVVENARRPDGTPLTKGQIQIQSEAAECFYKKLMLTPISTFPDKIKKAIRFKNEPPKKEVVLYIYGDVSAKGAVPSGDEPPFHPMRLGDAGATGMKQFAEALQAAGLDVREEYDQSIRFSAESLAGVDVLILGSNQRKFGADEAAAVKEWVEQGGGLVAWSDSAFGGDYREVGVDNPLGRDSDNLITEQFGMHFLTDNGGGNYRVSQFEEDHFLNRNQKNGGIRFRGEGVSFVRTSPPARILAKPQHGGMGGALRVNKVDGVLNAETDAALAIAEIGKGRVVGVFDRNLFWNAGSGTRLSHSDNREFAQRLILWAAGVEEERRIPESSDKINHGLNNPPEVAITQSQSEDGSTVHFIAQIVDNDTDAIIPEINWTQPSGPVSATFENNNPNTLTPTIRLPEKGTYQFRALIVDGEFEVRKSFKVTR